MKIVVQRSKEASCIVDGKKVGHIEYGLVLLVGFTETDGFDEITHMAKKVANLRIFDDEHGVMNKSLLDVRGSALSISQFTLYGDCKKGNRPSYINALTAEKARKLYEQFNEELKKYVHVETGIFQADMKIQLINDGPVTIILER